MRYLLLSFVLIFCSCSSENGQNDENIIKETVVVDEPIPTVELQEPEIITSIETVVIHESEIEQAGDVKSTFMDMVDVVNSATSADLEKLVFFLDREYVFKGKSLDEGIERIKFQLDNFQTEISDVNILGVNASCDLSYIIASYKKTITRLESGNERVDNLDKVGLFIMRKDDNGNWKLLVQKTDNGFAHWFYIPEEQKSM